jgi:hypothetical protein
VLPLAGLPRVRSVGALAAIGLVPVRPGGSFARRPQEAGKVRTWHGFRDQEAANGHLQSLEALFPLGAEYSYEFLSCPGSVGVVLHITVQRTPQIAGAHARGLPRRD